MSIRNPKAVASGDAPLPRKKPVKPTKPLVAPVSVNVQVPDAEKLRAIVASKIRPQLEARDRTPPPIDKMISDGKTAEIKPTKKKKHALDGKMLHVKVGDRSWDPDLLQSEIDKVEKQVEGLLDENEVDCLVLVTHYAVDVKLIEGE